MARYNHSSCRIGHRVFVVCGAGIGDHDLKSIELMSIKLKANGTVSYIARAWDLCEIEDLEPCNLPFVARLDDKTLLVYGGKQGVREKTGGIIFDADRKKTKTKIGYQDFRLYSYYCGQLRSDGIIVGVAVSMGFTHTIVFDPKVGAVRSIDVEKNSDMDFDKLKANLENSAKNMNTSQQNPEDEDREREHHDKFYNVAEQSEYNGQMDKDAKRQGFGSCVYPDGSFYEGYWKDDMHHGLGRKVYFNGDIYTGQFKLGYEHG